MNMHVSRRAALAMTAAAAIAQTPPARATRFDAGNPDDLLRAYMKLAGALDERLVIWWMEGRRHGLLDGTPKPLFGMQIGLFHRYRRQADGSFLYAMFELTYYMDLATGRALDTWLNPYTGATNKVVQPRFDPLVRKIDRGGQALTPGAAGGATIKSFSASLGPGVVNGDTVWIPTGLSSVVVPPFPGAPEIFVNSRTTVAGAVRDVEDDGVVSAPATLAFTNAPRWEPWMEMKGQPGHQFSQAFGRKFESVAALPQVYRDMARARDNDLFADPLAALEPVFTTIPKA
jgi:hypothetical protein